MNSLYHLKDILVQQDTKRILDIADLSIPSGQATAIVGANGAGKSTLLNLLAFINKPHRGDIAFKGESLSAPIAHAHRKIIAYVPQHPLLLAGSIVDNIKLALRLQGVPRPQHQQRIEQALEQVNLLHLTQRKSEQLSGGELKRAALARVLACQPKVLLLDEPFSHLDNYHHQLLQHIIGQFLQKTEHSVIFSTHDRTQANTFANSMIHLTKGSVTDKPILNLFNGRVKGQIFDTSQLQITIAPNAQSVKQISVDAEQIIITQQPFEHVMDNQFQGRVILIAQENTMIRLNIDCGERFQLLLQPAQFDALHIGVGSSCYIGFTKNAVSFI